jgi:uncharacterized NAD(P)/FAD-binding protein YdhS
MKTIAIVGFSFSGTIFFLNLIKLNLPKNLKIIIFEKEDLDSSKLNLGPAFSPFCDHYILNVSANNMSAYSDDQNHFVDFLKKEYPKIYTKIIKNSQSDDANFAPRKIYGKYLDKIRDQALQLANSKQIDYKILNQEVISIKSEGQKLTLITKKGNFKADKVILATSLKQTELPWSLASKNFIKNLWSKKYFDFHHQDLPKSLKNKNSVVTLIGSSLSAIDVIIGLIERNFNGKIIIISRRGNFSKTHLERPTPAIDQLLSINDARLGILAINLKIRRFLKENLYLNLTTIIALTKPIAKELWQNLDQKNRKRFLRLLPYWNIFRHTAPSSSIAIINKLIKDGRIEVRKGGVDKIKMLDKKIVIYNKNDFFTTDLLINCLGFEMNAKKYPLFDSMIKNNLLKQDLIMMKPNNRNIFLLGGLNIAQDFECTSIPNIRSQIEYLVSKIAEEI